MTNKMYSISEFDLVGILNMLTYDTYASLQRRLWRAGFNRRPYFSEYAVECQSIFGLDSIPPQAWYAGYQFIADLFDDNEQFKTPCDEAALLQQSIEQAINLLNKRR